MDLIDREAALGCFWSYGDMEGNGYDETDMPAYDRLQALPIVKEVEDCISRQETLNALCTPKGILYPIRTIENLPSAQPVRKTGQWIKRKKGAIGYNCSCCGKSDISNHFDYCPNCGADMRGGENETD